MTHGSRGQFDPCHTTGPRLVLLAIALAATVGCSPVGPMPTPPDPQPANSKAEDWTAARITQDPEGYIQWADGQLADQIQTRMRRLETLQGQQQDVATKRTEFVENVAEVRNLHARLERAYRKADEEERWPMVVAGASFDRRTAKAVIEKTKLYVEQRQPLESAYEQANRRLASACDGLKKEIEDLERLRQRLELDLERVRLNKGIAVMDQLRQTESDIASYAKVLREQDHTNNDLLDILNAKHAPPPVHVDSFLNEKPK